MIYVLGGGAPLNYKVVGGTSAPSNPKENTIWVNTSTAIKDYFFNPIQPGGVEGRVWIKIGTESSVAFNALKKNWLSVCPISAKQYVSGAWVDKTVKSYQGSKWVDWITDIYLYMNGTRYDDVTGGFKSLGIERTSDSDTTKIAPSVTYNSSKIKIAISTNGSGMVYTANKIDCTNYKTLHIKGILYCHGSSSLYRMFAALWSSIGTYASDNRGASWQNTASTQNVQDISIDISKLSGKYHIGFFFEQFGSLGSYIEISELWLEKK